MNQCFNQDCWHERREPDFNADINSECHVCFLTLTNILDNNLSNPSHYQSVVLAVPLNRPEFTTKVKFIVIRSPEYRSNEWAKCNSFQTVCGCLCQIDLQRESMKQGMIMQCGQFYRYRNAAEPKYPHGARRPHSVLQLEQNRWFCMKYCARCGVHEDTFLNMTFNSISSIELLYNRGRQKAQNMGYGGFWLAGSLWLLK